MIKNLFRFDPHHRCFLPLTVFFLSLVMAMGLTATYAQPADAPPPCPPEGCANPFDELLKKATLKKVLDNGSDASQFTGSTTIGGPLTVKGLEVKGNMKVVSHYFDANDDEWLRVKDKDGGTYKDVAVGRFWADQLAYLRGDIRLGDDQNSGKLYFGYADSSKYIAVENWWMAFHGHGNEGWKFIDDTGDVIMQINGKGANDGNVSIPRALVTGELKISAGAAVGKVLTSDANGNATWQAAPSPIPSGTSGQTLRHDGTKWVANSLLLNNGSKVGIGMANPISTLDVYAQIQWVQTEGRAAGYGEYSTATGYYVNFNGDFYKQFSAGDKFKTGDTIYTVRGIKDPGGYVFIDKAYVFPPARWNAPVFLVEKAPMFRVANEMSPQAFIVDGKGNVGVGTANPVSPLTIYNSSNVGPKLTLAAPGGGNPSIDFRPYQNDSQWSSPAQASITATDNNWSADIHFSTKSSGALGNALVDRVFIKNDGNVGIGTTDPKSRLQVNGTLGLHDANGDDGKKWSIYGWDNQLQFTKRNNDWSYNSTPLTIWEDGSISIPGIIGVGGIKFATGAGAGKVLTSDASGNATWQAASQWVTTGNNISYTNGKVGIGTSGFSTGEKLAVKGDEGTQFGIYPGYLDNVANTDWVTMEIPGAKNLRVWDSFSVDGKVGLGTTSPNAKLEIWPSPNSWSGDLNALRITSPDSRYRLNVRTEIVESGIVGWVFRTHHADNSSESDALSISSLGNVGIGKTNPTQKLEVNGHILANAMRVYGGYCFETSNGMSDCISRGAWNSVKNVGGSSSSKPFTGPMYVRGSGGSGQIRIAPTTSGEEASIGFYESPSFDTNALHWVIGKGAWHSSNKDFLRIGSTVMGSPLMTFDDDGNGSVGIGTDNPDNSYRLHVIGSMNLAYNGNDTVALNDKEKLAFATDRIGLDVAELFEAEEQTEVGDIVVVSEKGRKVRKSSTPYQNEVIGVVSGSPAILFEGSSVIAGPKLDRFTKGKKPPVALAGRVPVKVSLENGSIKPGDYLTTSSIPGVAMKATDAGQTIGVALEFYDQHREGKVLTFINIGEKNVGSVIKKLEKRIEDLEQRER